MKKRRREEDERMTRCCRQYILAVYILEERRKKEEMDVPRAKTTLVTVTSLLFIFCFFLPTLRPKSWTLNRATS